jgi:hypothetical protein
MTTKITIVIATAAALLGSVAGTTVFGQAQSTGHWQMVAGSGGDGAVAWKLNMDTGQSFFCYRQSCFESVLTNAPARLP